MMDHSSRIERTSLPRVIAARVRDQIDAGRYGPDAFLPGERDLAAEFQVSRRTIAKALELLCESGEVVRSQGRGTQVCSPAARSARARVAVLAAESNPIWPEYLGIVRGIHDTLQRLCHTPVDCRGRSIDCTIDELTTWAGGYVLIEAVSPRHLAAAVELERRHIPVVIANLEGGGETPVSATCVNHRAVGLKATRLLLDLGHRRIAFVGNEPDRYFYGQARLGYLDALRDAGVALDQRYLVSDSRPMVLAGYLATLQLLNLPQPPTAVFAARDGYGEGVIQAAREKGLTIGRDISVVGYDDLTHAPENPIITTFREPAHALGAAAAEMVIDRMRHGWKPIEHQEIEAPLVMRRSAGPYFPPEKPASAGRPTTEVAAPPSPTTS